MLHRQAPDGNLGYTGSAACAAGPRGAGRSDGVETGKIIDKIYKCLRLAESCNPNEAASALRQAQGLMRKYGISEELVSTAPVAEASVAAGERYNPPFWLMALSELVACAFQCRVYLLRAFGRQTRLKFIGLGAAPEIASYTFMVLQRRLADARAAFRRRLDGEEDEAEAERQADVFAQAWLYRVAAQISQFAEDGEAQQAIDKYIEVHYGQVRDAPRDPTETVSGDILAINCGLRAGEDVRLFRPVRHGEAEALLESEGGA